jgi:putative ABC transport system substrate-binding protein
VKRRDFITLLGGAAAAWPLAVRAQQGQRMRRIGVLMHLAADDPEGQRRVAAFLQGLQEAGWAVGRNVDIDMRWAAGEAERFRRYAMEILALTPDVILASATPSVLAVQQATRTVPIVFVLVPDAVGTGIVASLSRPGGNTTGFTSPELGMSVKWLELLKEIAPKAMRAAVLRDPANPAGIGQFGAIQGAGSSFGVEINPIGVGNAEEIERGITAFAREPNGGLIVLALPTTVINRNLIIRLAAQHRLPAVYNSRYWIAEGGLVSYGPDVLDQYRRTQPPQDCPLILHVVCRADLSFDCQPVPSSCHVHQDDLHSRVRRAPSHSPTFSGVLLTFGGIHNALLSPFVGSV